ncbi:MAG: hypothetical protein ACTHJX_07660 [Terriglobales bacterium]
MGLSILGCPHNHLSFPMVTREPHAPAPPGDASGAPLAHVTCLDCGREFWYDWGRMRRLSERLRPVYPPRRAA